MHESLVSGDDCIEAKGGKKKRSTAKKEGKRERGAEEENGERWKRVRRSSAG